MCRGRAADFCLPLCRSEWQVRKAAADTLAVLAETLLAGGKPASDGAHALAPAAAAAKGVAGSGATHQQQQEQGVAALESIAPAIVAAVTQYVKYDRIPQVRQAAAAVLLHLYRLPGLQQEERPPAHQLPGGRGAAGPRSGRPAAGPAHGKAAAPTAEATDAPAAAAPALAAASPKGLRHSRESLQAVIAERRQQLKAAGWQPAAAVVVYGPAGDSRKTPAAGAAASAPPSGVGHASSVGSADGDWPAAQDRIRAWAGAAEPLPPLAPRPVQDEQQPQQPKQQGERDAAAAAPLLASLRLRPPSADVFQAAAEVMERLHPQHAARRRRAWGSYPASPVKHGIGGSGASGAASQTAAVQAAAQDAPLEMHLPPAPAGGLAATQALAEEHVWRENPLAQSAEGPVLSRPHAQAAAGAGAAAAAGAGQLAPQAVPCVHHIEHPKVGPGSAARHIQQEPLVSHGPRQQQWNAFQAF